MASSATVSFPDGQKTIPSGWFDAKKWHEDTKHWTAIVWRDGKRYEVESHEQSVPVSFWYVKREIIK